MRIYRELFAAIIQPEHLFWAWKEFRRGKGMKEDVAVFEQDLEQHIFQLARDLQDESYQHGGYHGFYISDPKLRHIHKASVRDRVLHHAVYAALLPVFEPTFIAHSFSCRVGKGTHKGVRAVAAMLRSESRNNTRTCYALKCDIQKFFDSIDHAILLSLLGTRIKDEALMRLLENIVESYVSVRSDLFHRRGVPIGNLTSQLFANVYMNEFDQFIKHTLKVQHYARYTDDFIIVSSDRRYLESLMEPIHAFLRERLSVQLHPHKVQLLTYTKGIDFLGYVLFPTHTLLRSKTKRRMIRKFEGLVRAVHEGSGEKERVMAALHSYAGILSHANGYSLITRLKNYVGLWIR